MAVIITTPAETIQHYQNDLKQHIEVEEESFSSRDEVKNWMNNIEINSNVRFVQPKSHILKSGTSTTYSCHRSGEAIDKSKSQRERKIKLKGSKKLNTFCPASVKIVHNVSKSCYTVQFVKTHIGHDITDKRELGFINLHSEEQRQLASKIALGVPNQRIIDLNLNALVLEDYLHPELRRSNLTTQGCTLHRKKI